MSRRVHVSAALAPGRIDLDPTQAHHLRDVLRLMVGDVVEAFDDAGRIATAMIDQCDACHVIVRVDVVSEPQKSAKIVIASAVPKGDRADWMIEKLSELGVSRFIPLQTARSVVLPKGQGKRDRWIRIATESAKQSRRGGVMGIDELTSIQEAVEGQKKKGGGFASYLSTETSAIPLIQSFSALLPLSSALLLIGPEGGWTDAELGLFRSANLTGVKLTETILRVETAAIAAAAIVASLLSGANHS